MMQGLQNLQHHHLAAELEEALFPHLVSVIKMRGDGHCMRVSNLDDALMIRLGTRLQAELPGAQVALLTDNSGSSIPEGLGVTSTKLVELRNPFSDGSQRPPLIVFVPSDMRAAAEDSFGIATFEEIPVGNLYDSVKRRLLQKLPGDFKGPVTELLKRLVDAETPWLFADDYSIVRFLLSGKINGFDGDAIGASLYELGLIPDFELLNEPEKAPSRILRNRECVELLTWSDKSERGRVLDLGLSQKVFRSDLADFIVEAGVEDPKSWTHKVVLDRGNWKLAFNHWEFEDSEELDSAYIFDVTTNLPEVADDEKDPTLSQLVGQKYLALGKSGLKKFNVTFSVDPLPTRIQGLNKFVLQVISRDHGPVGLVRSKAVWKTKKSDANVAFTRLNKVDWEEGWHFVRVLAQTEDGELIPLVDEYGKPLPWAADDDAPVTRVNESDLFYVLPDTDIEVAPEQRAVQKEESLMHALFRLQFSALIEERDYTQIKPQSVDWSHSSGTRAGSLNQENLELRFGREGHINVPISNTLKQLEQRILATPEGPLGWHMPVVNGHVEACTGISAKWPENDLADEFLQIRARYFEAIRSEPKELISQACDLTSLRSLIVEYADSYSRLIQNCIHLAGSRDVDVAQKALLDLRYLSALDSVQVVIRDYRGQRRQSVLVSPTHPLRALWLCTWAEMGKVWLEKTQNASDYAVAARDALLKTLTPLGYPPVLPDSNGTLLTAVDNLNAYWSLYAPANEHDPRGLIGQVCQLLGIPEPDVGGATIDGKYLATRVQRYLIQHPYVDTLVINAFNTGRSLALANMLLQLQKHKAFSHIHYDIRLFVSDADAPGVGEKLIELLSPLTNAKLSEADAFSTVSSSHLQPKLSLAIKPLEEYRNNPESYSAHLSLLFDVFPAQEVGVVSVSSGEGYIPVHGLAQDFLVNYTDEDDIIAWSRFPKHGRAIELPGAEELSDLLSSLPEQMSTAIATSSTGQVGSRLRPEVTMALTTEHRALLHQVHETSDWVMTVDRNLGIEFFDHGRLASRPDYLIDHSPDSSIGLGHKLFITSRSIEELEALLKPVLKQYDLKSSANHVVALLDQLRSLSGRLALKLISSPTQRAEALGLALARMYLEYQGVFDNQILVPLDAHLELYQSLKKQADELGGEISFKRTDLALFDLDVSTRTVTCRLVEVKCYSDVGDLGAYTKLKDDISLQISESESVLAQHFDPYWGAVDRPDRPLKNRELASLLSFYLDRTNRYGSMSSEAADEAKFFLDTFDNGYELGFTRSALIFDFAKPGTEPAELDCGIEFHRIGYDLIQELVDASAIVLSGDMPDTEDKDASVLDIKRTHAPSLPTLDEAAFLSAYRDRTVSWDELSQASIVGQLKEAKQENVDESLTVQVQPGVDLETNNLSIQKVAPENTSISQKITAPSVTTVVNEGSDTESRRQLDSEPPSVSSNGEGDIFLPLEYDVMLGVNGKSEQYGLLGEIAGRKVALDLNHTHTISLFGVQGGGKSYTLGTVVEMATARIPAISQLKKPLSTVIFHYSPTQDYKPEFTSMIGANDDQKQLQMLRERYGAEPTSLTDVVLLTPMDKLEERKQEYPGIEVHPLKFASSELQAGHWKFLMGAVGNQAAYIRQLTNIMRKNRDGLTLDGLIKGVESSRMSDAMKDLALMRLDFADQYIDDALGVSSLIRPGRMIIVDLRDEFIEKDEALGLFVVLLQIFSEAKYLGEAFNKLIVFDECHKYIDSPDLVKGLIEVVREMRHKGTSVMVASQDPPSVPVELIELSSQIVLHKFNSPAWLKHIQKANSALNQLTPQKLANLQPGEAFVWSSKASDLEFTKQALKIRCRPRVTKHGGDTKTAI
ncbi:methylation-associated defense system ATP-binding protein MAD8 [Vibrio owensii]|uniref:methylation-associated defense system ATP-binding protein MAD8 n=1 Tax=Vibrio owensii TaxID=696485 RepID=UPI00406982E6